MLLDSFWSPTAQSSALPLWCCFILAGVGILVVRNARAQRSLPPGPKRRWILGNLWEMDGLMDVKVMEKWRHEYGDIVYFETFGRSIIVLNSAQAISDLVEKRGSLYSHRPRLAMPDLIGFSKSIAIQDHTAEFRQLKKAVQHALGPSVILKYEAIQERVLVDYMQDLISNPEGFLERIAFFSARIILAITYGIPVNDTKDQYVHDAEDQMHAVNKLLRPGAYMVDIIPALRYLAPVLPFMSWVREVREAKVLNDRFAARPFESVKKQIAANCAPQSILSDLLAHFGEEGAQEGQENYEDGVKWAAATMYGAGVETTYTVLATFFLLMSFHPNAQAAAQSEIDNVIGSSRLVHLSDRSRLPYVDALIQEVMRWNVPAPLASGRRIDVEDEYQGYRIPAGSWVIPNTWALSRNDQADAERFRPERFLENPQTPNPSDYVFGYGRRMCLGKDLAQNTVFLFISNVLARFNITRIPEKEGGLRSLQEVTFQTGFMRSPEKFKCNVSPRSAETRGWIAELVEGLPPFDASFVNASNL